jgi:aromatic-L-amino-acid decarboxylase
LRTSESDEVKNLMDYGVSLGRRFRALKLWMVIRALGVTGLQRTIRAHISWAARLAEKISAHPDFHLITPVHFSTLVFRYVPAGFSGDESDLEVLNGRMLEAINRSGQVFLSHTKVKGIYCLRLTIGNFKTSWDDVALAWQIIRDSAQKTDA